MNTLIVSGGSLDPAFAGQVLEEGNFTYRIAADRGLQFFYKNQILPTHIVGDFDSMDREIVERYREEKALEIRTHNPVKDFTDTESAVELAMELGSTSITILGGTGTRLDHVLGNIQVLMQPLFRGIPCVLLDPHNRISLLKEGRVLRREEQYGAYVSFLPLTTVVRDITLEGFKYPLHRHLLTSDNSLGVSNELVEEAARVSFSEGILIMVESRD